MKFNDKGEVLTWYGKPRKECLTYIVWRGWHLSPLFCIGKYASWRVTFWFSGKEKWSYHTDPGGWTFHAGFVILSVSVPHSQYAVHEKKWWNKVQNNPRG